MYIPYEAGDSVLAHNRTVLLDALRAVGVASAVIAYSGYGGLPNPNVIQILDNEGSALAGDQTVSVQQKIIGGAGDRSRTGQGMTNISLRHALDGFSTLALSIHYPHYEKTKAGPVSTLIRIRTCEDRLP
jgi:hypothetical protein